MCSMLSISLKRERKRVILISCFKILRFIHARKFLKFCGEEASAPRNSKNYFTGERMLS